MKTPNDWEDRGMKPNRWKIEVHGWQNQGFFGEIWQYRNTKCGYRVHTLPRSNFACPGDLYATRKECRAACDTKVQELRAANVFARSGVLPSVATKATSPESARAGVSAANMKAEG